MTQIDALKTDEIQNYEIEHQEEVRRLAGECMVILENDGVLPLQAGTKKIALFGTGARHTIKGGTGSGDVNVRENISIAQGLEHAGFKFVTEGWLDQYDRLYADAQEAYVKKLNEFTEKTGKPSMLYAFENPFEEPEQPEITEADVKEADAAIYVISRNSGEGKDRRAEKGDYYLSDRELQNIRFMTEHYKNCIVLLNVGGVIDLTALKAIEGVQAIMLVGQTGNMGGYAVADVLTAKTIPSGKLTDTWARSYEDYPSSATFSHRDGNLDDEYYSDGIYVGYRYFDTFGVMPLYCFGYGKSYTEFEIKTMNVTADEKQVQVEVEVTNIGDKYPGKEVVQVYYSAPDGIMEKPTQELAGFAKTKLLAPGEKDVVTITFATTDMASFDAYDAAWVMEEGEYTIRVGNSSRNTEAVAVIDLDEQVTTLQLKRLMRDTIAVRELHHMIPIFDIEFDFGVPAIPFRIMLQAENFKKELVEYEVMRRTLMDKRKDEVLTLEDVKAGNATLDELTAIKEAYEQSEGELFVGLNRRHAPLIQQIKREMKTDQIPAVYDFIGNAGFIPKDHWVHDEAAGGGRILGEACHFVDLIQYLDGSHLEDLTVTAASNNAYPMNDNVLITLRFASGAIGNIVYSSMGSKKYPKEQLRVLSNGSVYEMDNFIRLKKYGSTKSVKEKLKQDKGIHAEYEYICKVLRGQEKNTVIADAFRGQELLIKAMQKVKES